MRAEARTSETPAALRRPSVVAKASPERRKLSFDLDRAAVLRAAWRRYRFAYGNEDGFFPDLFAAVLEREWAVLRFQREHGAEQARRDGEAAARQAREPRRFMGAPVPPALARASRNTISRS
ncbi:hypothetical protein [Antarcticirhabdus aurantiaca]|uniref:Uncharacterized protein n=1 Tax=Antarcticirhabdus aurantiaca TaxID=2606717 RepID=A0ACD4NHT7_9HYPH|nr:hypothetical protein [Antarcticirhabdus aurantiaca]WAJ26413.1 hypothetical protein OXU80_16095 [Jeongeuplla avenae]